MSDTQDQERWIDKVQKLLNKAERAATPEEAETFFAKAAELMQRYAIDDAMLAASGKIDDQIVDHRIHMKSSYLIGLMELGFAVGRGYKFKLLQSKYRGQGTVTWIGWQSDVTKAELLLTSLMIQMERAARDYIETFKNERFEDWELMRPMDRHVLKRSFMIGFAQETESRLHKAHRAAQAEAVKAEEAAASSSPGVALVLASRSDQLQQYYDDKFKNLRAGRASRINHNAGAAGAGRAAGAAASHGGTGVGGGPKGELR